MPLNAMQFDVPRDDEMGPEDGEESEGESEGLSFGEEGGQGMEGAGDWGEGEKPYVESPEEEDGRTEWLDEREGSVSGKIVSERTGAPIQGVAVVLEDTDLGTITGTDGMYSMSSVPEGVYTLSLVKSGYVEVSVSEFEVMGGESKTFDFALASRADESGGDVYKLENFSVTEEEATALMSNLELRMTSDSLLDAMDAEDLSRFASSDVGDAVKRVSGVTVQEGKFAVIRGLDERYSSSLLNGVPVPSPDPERQSVPLDLFPSDVVRNLVVTKTYSPELPGNSAGGSIDIRTNLFPDRPTVNVSTGGDINSNARQRFLAPSQSREGIDFDDVLDVDARERQGFGGVPREIDRNDVIGNDFSFEFGDRFEGDGPSIGILGAISRKESFDTAIGVEQKQEARIQDVSGGQLGDLSFTGPRFDFTESESQVQQTFLLALEAALDREGNHTIGYTVFRTDTREAFAALRENGHFPGKIAGPEFGDGSDFVRRFETEDRIKNETVLGQEFPAVVDNLIRTLTGSEPTNADRIAFYEQMRLIDLIVMEVERDLTVHQFNGSHSLLDGVDNEFDLSWGLSSATTTQEENDAFRAGGFELSDQFGGDFITGEVAGGFDGLSPERSWRRIREDQDFYRVDGSYKRRLSDNVSVEPMIGVFGEDTERDTDQFFTGVRLKNLGGNSVQPFPSLEEAIAENIANNPENTFQPAAVARGERTADGFYFNGKASFFEKLDLIGGARFEQVNITTSTSTGRSGAQFFNSAILQGNPDGSDPDSAVRNTALLGINGGRPLPPGFKGEIDEDLVLPAATVNLRPWEGTRLSFAYSQTNVRPSFKEFTFLTVRNPTTLSLESGNPALMTSDVESFDLRLEHTFNDSGDRAAIGLFQKRIENPIERTNLSNTEIFFNNPNPATVRGVEIEARKKLDFFGSRLLEWFSIGGNVTFIDAEVDIPETFRDRLRDRFGIENPDKSRRLYQQPRWIINTDLRFDQPGWGTTATLALFAQSEVLESAGGFEGRNASVDRFQSPFEELNFTLSQRLNDVFSLKFAVKNLTDSTRGIEYDQSFGTRPERRFTVGREFALSISGEF